MVEGQRRDVVELRQALKCALDLAPKQLTTGAASATATDGQQRGETTKHNPKVSSGPRTPAQGNGRALTYGDIAEQLEAMLNQRLPFSRYVPELGYPICGTFLVARDVAPEFGSLSDAQIALAQELFDA